MILFKQFQSEQNETVCTHTLLFNKAKEQKHTIQESTYHLYRPRGRMGKKYRNSFNGIGNILLLQLNGGLMAVGVLIIHRNLYLVTIL